MLRNALIILLFSLSFPVLAAPLPNEAQEARAQALFAQYRCMVCAGQPLADSPAAPAADIRDAVRAMIASGADDAEINATLVARYGDSILLFPPFNAHTYFLWFGPLIALALGVAVIFAYFGAARVALKNVGRNRR